MLSQSSQYSRINSHSCQQPLLGPHRGWDEDGGVSPQWGPHGTILTMTHSPESQCTPWTRFGPFQGSPVLIYCLPPAAFPEGPQLGQGTGNWASRARALGRQTGTNGNRSKGLGHAGDSVGEKPSDVNGWQSWRRKGDSGFRISWFLAKPTHPAQLPGTHCYPADGRCCLPRHANRTRLLSCWLFPHTFAPNTLVPGAACLDYSRGEEV